MKSLCKLYSSTHVLNINIREQLINWYRLWWHGVEYPNHISSCLSPSQNLLMIKIQTLWPSGFSLNWALPPLWTSLPTPYSFSLILTVLLALRSFCEDSNYVLGICLLSFPFPRAGTHFPQISSWPRHSVLTANAPPQRSLPWSLKEHFTHSLPIYSVSCSTEFIVTWQYNSGFKQEIRKHLRFFEKENFKRGNVCITKTLDGLGEQRSDRALHNSRKYGRAEITRKLQPWPQLPEKPQDCGYTGVNLVADANATLAVCSMVCLSFHRWILALSSLFLFRSVKIASYWWAPIGALTACKSVQKTVLRAQGLASPEMLRKVDIRKWQQYLVCIYSYSPSTLQNHSLHESKDFIYFPDIVKK